VIREQINKALTNVRNPTKLTIAYEPVWAIGTGSPASPSQVTKVIDNTIRPELTRIYGHSLGADMPILYGGSINNNNAMKFLKEDSIHGTLLGNASLNAKQFSDIARLTSEAKIST
jgi:triosephosphate isomerase